MYAHNMKIASKELNTNLNNTNNITVKDGAPEWLLVHNADMLHMQREVFFIIGLVFVLSFFTFFILYMGMKNIKLYIDLQDEKIKKG